MSLLNELVDEIKFIMTNQVLRVDTAVQRCFTNVTRMKHLQNENMSLRAKNEALQKCIAEKDEFIACVQKKLNIAAQDMSDMKDTIDKLGQMTNRVHKVKAIDIDQETGEIIVLNCDKEHIAKFLSMPHVVGDICGKCRKQIKGNDAWCDECMANFQWDVPHHKCTHCVLENPVCTTCAETIYTELAIV